VQTQRDREVVEWVGRIGAAGAEHVMRRFGMSRSRAYGRLNRLVGEGLLMQRTLLHRQAGLYVASMQGLRWCGLARLGVHRVGVAGFVHARELAAAAVELHEALDGWQLLGERELRVHEAEEGELLASVAVAWSERRALHRPDLALVGPDGRSVAVEVELSVKAPRRLAAICTGYARAGHVDRVYCLAAP